MGNGTEVTPAKKDLRPQRSERLATKKTEAAPARTSTEQKSSQELDAPVDLQKAGGHEELMSQASRLAASMYGVHDIKLAGQVVDQAMRIQAAWCPGSSSDPLENTMTMLLEMEAKSFTEALLAVQMVGVHSAALTSLQRASMTGPIEGPDVHMARATRLMRLFHEQAEVMAKLKGRVGHQEVRVEHIHIHKGGQAVVGAVDSAKLKQGEGGRSEKRKKTL